MDKRFLNKVLDQIVSETRIDYVKERVNVPFLLPFPFFDHCESVYGLNEEETRYVWNEYVQTIKDKINNG